MWSRIKLPADYRYMDKPRQKSPKAITQMSHRCNRKINAYCCMELYFEWKFLWLFFSIIMIINNWKHSQNTYCTECNKCEFSHFMKLVHILFSANVLFIVRWNYSVLVVCISKPALFPALEMGYSFLILLAFSPCHPQLVCGAMF